MSTWRARHFSATVIRRHRVTFTIRRFRPGRHSRLSRKYVMNVRFGRVRQFQLQHQRLGKKRQIAAKLHWQSVAAAACMILGLAGLTFSAAALAKPTSLQPAHEFKTTAKAVPVTQTAPTSKPQTLGKSLPTHITIASQDIDVDLIPVGLNPDGSMETPPVLDWVAGWYKYSPTPGELGPAVIVGHVDSYEGISVFWTLRNVQAGDTIDVAREDGSLAHFQVTQLAQYDQQNFPSDKVYGNTTDAELRVITCGGTFDTSTGHYTQNTVVYATLVS
jgi:sortase (surface protein transpeptidase)